MKIVLVFALALIVCFSACIADTQLEEITSLGIKDSYILGETVEVSAANPLRSAVYIQTSPDSYWAIYKNEEKVITELLCTPLCENDPCRTEQVDCSITDATFCKEIKEGEIIGFSWDQTTVASKNFECGATEITCAEKTQVKNPGTYKAELCYYENAKIDSYGQCVLIGEKKCIENEFTIKGEDASLELKIDYEQGENIAVTFKTTQEDIYFCPLWMEDWNGWSVYKQEAGGWAKINSKPITLSCDCTDAVLSCPTFEAPAFIKILGSTTFEWDQQVFSSREAKCGEESYGMDVTTPAGLGTYTVEFCYYTSRVEGEFCGNDTTGKDCIKKEFTIKGEDTTNCSSYGMPMSEAEIENCTCPKGYDKINRLGGAACVEQYEDSMSPCNNESDCEKPELCTCQDDDCTAPKCMRPTFGCYKYYEGSATKTICVD